MKPIGKITQKTENEFFDFCYASPGTLNFSNGDSLYLILKKLTCLLHVLETIINILAKLLQEQLE